jgi:serine/threonine protein kinase
MLNKNGVGYSSDIYGIGCILYEMVVGVTPYFN